MKPLFTLSFALFSLFAAPLPAAPAATPPRPPFCNPFPDVREADRCAQLHQGRLAFCGRIQAAAQRAGCVQSFEARLAACARIRDKQQRARCLSEVEKLGVAQTPQPPAPKPPAAASQPPAPAPPAAGVVRVPDVGGMPLKEALQILERAGLRGQVEGEIETKLPQNDGKAYMVSPSRGGVSVRRGSIVRLRVIKFHGVAVPNVVGLPAQEACGALTRAGLRCTLHGQVDTPDRGRHGRVASQAFRPGWVLARGSDVNLVRFGPPPALLRPNEVLLPDVVGRPLAEALQILERAGLRGAVDGEITTRNPQAAGRVSSSTPYPSRGARVPRGSLVRLRVYRLAAQ